MDRSKDAIYCDMANVEDWISTWLGFKSLDLVSEFLC